MNTTDFSYTIKTDSVCRNKYLTVFKQNNVYMNMTKLKADFFFYFNHTSKTGKYATKLQQ